MARTIIDAMQDHNLFAPWFHPWANWRQWAVVVKAIFGLPMDTWERKLFRELYGNRKPPTAQASEALILAGRGAGKSLIAALIVSYMAALMDWSHLKRKVRVLCLAADREQAEEVLIFVGQFFTESPLLASLVLSRTKSSITLKSGVKLSIRTASARGIRGPAVAACVADEITAWPRDPSINSDTKVLRALRPALGKVSGSLLVSIGSTGSRDGAAFELFEANFGKDNAPILTCRARSTQLNITKDHAAVVAKTRLLDPYAARAEYDSLWMDDAAAFLSRDRVHIVDVQNPQPPKTGRVFIGLDPNGGSLAGDAFAMAAAWVVNGRIKVGMVESRTGRRDPTEVVKEFASILAPYRARVTICSDGYAAQWVPSAFARHGLQLRGPHRLPRGDTSSGRMSASDYYVAMLGRLAVTDFPNDPRLLGEMYGLVRTPNGVDHPSGKHDDVANSVARAVFMAGWYLDLLEPVIEYAPAAELDDADAPMVLGVPDATPRESDIADLDAAPTRGSLAERLEHAGAHASYTYHGDGRWS